MTRSLERRYRALLCLTATELVRRRPESGSWSALEYAAHVGEMLGVTQRRLRRLLSEDAPGRVEEVRIEAPTAGANGSQTITVVACLSDNAARLAGTINEATAEDWHRGSPGNDAAELVWMALHDAIHHLEDTELTLAQSPIADGERRSYASAHG